MIILTLLNSNVNEFPLILEVAMKEELFGSGFKGTGTYVETNYRSLETSIYLH